MNETIKTEGHPTDLCTYMDGRKAFETWWNKSPISKCEAITEADKGIAECAWDAALNTAWIYLYSEVLK